MDITKLNCAKPKPKAAAVVSSPTYSDTDLCPTITCSRTEDRSSPIPEKPPSPHPTPTELDTSSIDNKTVKEQGKDTAKALQSFPSSESTCDSTSSEKGGTPSSDLAGTRSPDCASVEENTLSPAQSIKLTQSILDAQKLVDSISRSLSKEAEDGKDKGVDKMVQGNGRLLALGPYAKQNVAAENLARYFAMQTPTTDVKVALHHGNSCNLKYPALLTRKENTFQGFGCENGNSESNNSEEEEDVEFADDENGDWSFDEEDDEVKPGKQCACAFKHSGHDNGTKVPLQRQDSNHQDVTGGSPLSLQTNPFFMASHVLPCPDCEESFNCRVDLNRHRLKHMTERSFKCSHCDKAFAFSFNLKSHERQHTGEKPYVCNECGLSFVHAFNFHEHRQVHNSRDNFVCNICLKWFNVESKYLLHIQRHSSIKPFKCSICGKAFHRAAGLRAHELIHSSGKESQQYFCRFCDKTFVRLSHKQMHERVHYGKKLLPCLRCHQTFTDLGLLKSHECGSSSSAQQFRCNVCKDVFPTRELLECHSRLHAPRRSAENRPGAQQVRETKFGIFKRRAPTGSTKRRFPCQLCSQAFSTKRLLEDHARIHQREKTPFMCKVCSLAFTHSNYLQLHLATHDGKDGASSQAQRAGSCWESTSSGAESKSPLPQSLSPGYDSPLSGRSRQSSGDHSACPSPLNKSPPVHIKSEPE